jgi:hypothetical protein
MRASFCLASALWLFVGVAQAAEPQVEASLKSYGTVQFTFDRPMQVWDEETAPGARAVMTPGGPLRCHWSDDTSLDCSPADRDIVAPGNRYRIELGTGLLSQTGEPLRARRFTLESERPRLRVRIPRWRHGRPEIELHSDGGASAEAIAKVLRLKRDGRRIPAPALRALPADRSDGSTLFVLALPDDAPAGAEYALSVTPGLIAASGPLPSTQTGVLLRVRERAPLRVREVSCTDARTARWLTVRVESETMEVHCAPETMATVSFSQLLTPEARAAFAARLPEGLRLLGWGETSAETWFIETRAKDSAPIEPPGSVARLQIDRAGLDAMLLLDEAMRGQLGEGIAPLRLRLRSGAFAPQLRAAHPRLLLAGDAASPPVQAINTPKAEFSVHALGARGRRERMTVPALVEDDAALDSPATLQALAEGGWARWLWRSGAPLELAAPQFDLRAIATRSDVLVWARAWDGSGSLSGAEVELLMARSDADAPAIIASARTDAGGVARLALPPNYRLPELPRGERAHWLVRAVHHGSRAVLPVGGTGNYGLRLGTEIDEVHLWGVPDRPLYRAGETVRYRLWRRVNDDGRLRGAGAGKPLELMLFNVDEGKPIRTWQAAADAHGGLVGEERLPQHLTDATYCIGVEDDDGSTGIGGACFFVGTFRAQDLWAEARTEDRVLRDGDIFAVDVAAGYYSGGAASGLKLSRVSTLLTGLPLAQAYPAFADYTFIDTSGGLGRDGAGLAGEDALQRDLPTTDADGRVRLAVPVRFDADEEGDMPAFAALQLVAELRLDAREGTSSNAARARYARFDRYVGLRLIPHWFDAREPLRLQSVVIDAEGRAVSGVAVEVRVEFLPTYDAKATPQPVATCALTSGVESECKVPRVRSGRYRFIASSGGAAAATIERYVWVDDAPDGDRDVRNAPKTELILLDPPRADAPARLRLAQPYPRADALLVVSAGNTLLEYRTFALDRPYLDFDLAVPADGPLKRRVQVHVLERGRAASVVDGLRMAPVAGGAELEIERPSVQRPRTVEVAFDRPRAAPGETVTLRLHNRDSRPRRAAVSVGDDGLRALAADWLAFSDPFGEHWLGADLQRGWWRPFSASFAGWNTGSWRWTFPQRRVEQAPGDAATPVMLDAPPRPSAPDVDRGDARQVAVAEAPPAPVTTIDRAQIEAGEPGATGDMLFDISASDGGALINGGGLDSIEVVGSRIARAEVFSEGTGRLEGVRMSPRAATSDVRHAVAVRLRSRFADVALWEPDLALAPGEIRTLSFVVPDNLTRWRATVWSADADDGFEKTDVALDVGLPLEVRLQTPVRVFPGDTADLAANVRNAGEAAVALDAALQVDALQAGNAQTLNLPARGQGAFTLRIAPDDAALSAGASTALSAVASVRGDRDGDAVSAQIELASPILESRRTQAGWLGTRPLSLTLPRLPEGAHDASVQVSLLPGVDGLVHGWIGDLHAYPHRCWEQILSRAIGAAVAIERGDSQRFPDARAAIAEALENAAVFQTEDGSFRYFADSASMFNDEVSVRYVALTAYSVRVLRLLRASGHAVPESVLEDAEAFLADADPEDFEEDGGDAADALQALAVAVAVDDEVDTDVLDALWARWSALDLSARIATARALAANGHPAAPEAVSRLSASARVRGEARVLQVDARAARWMSSDLREQCEFIALLDDYPALGNTTLRRALLAGLSDLYAGGRAAVDTQTAASCLIALRGVGDRDEVAAALEIVFGEAHGRLQLGSGEEPPSWRQPLQTAVVNPALLLRPQSVGDAPASYVAQVRYREDARRAASTAVGFALQREYAVFRDGRWVPLASMSLASMPLQDGDWVRITLTIDSAAPRYFVALTDGVPGGLRPTDLALGGLAGLDLQALSGQGSHWFATRRLDPRAPKFYAEYLPPGRHEVHYFARVGNAGDYLAPPALAELMYGEATRARTAAQRLRIAP